MVRKMHIQVLKILWCSFEDTVKRRVDANLNINRYESILDEDYTPTVLKHLRGNPCTRCIVELQYMGPKFYVVPTITSSALLESIII